MVYTKGQLIQMQCTFTDQATGEKVDPDAVTVEFVLTPFGGTPGTPTSFTYPVGVTKQDVGIYQYLYSATTSGDLSRKWYSTGNGQAAVESVLTIQPSAFATP